MSLMKCVEELIKGFPVYRSFILTEGLSYNSFDHGLVTKLMNFINTPANRHYFIEYIPRHNRGELMISDYVKIYEIASNETFHEYILMNEEADVYLTALEDHFKIGIRV
jgi:hypothetical protein